MQKINKILCATDLSKSSRDFLSRGIEFCLRFDACFSIFHAVPPPLGSVSRRVEFERGGEKEERIEKACTKIKKFMGNFDVEWDLIVTYGDPVLEIAKAAEKIRPDIVIAASHGLSGFQQFLYAKTHKTDLIIAGVDNYPGRIIPSTTDSLFYHLPCAVLIVPVN